MDAFDANTGIAIIDPGAGLIKWGGRTKVLLYGASMKKQKMIGGDKAPIGI